MDALLARSSIGISELREAPARVFEQAGDEALVVLNHNRPAGYIVSNTWMQRVLDQLADKVVEQRAVERVATRAKARRISVDDL